jgi:hypothetical protein
VLHDEGFPLVAVQDRPRHADAHTIMKRYVHLSRRAERQEADGVSRHFRDSDRGKTWSESGSKFGSKSDVGDTVVVVEFLGTARYPSGPRERSAKSLR